MGCQLLRKGREYQRRHVSSSVNVALPDFSYGSCTFRADPVHKGDKVVPPGSFPPALPSDPNMIPDELPSISDEVLEEVSHNPTPNRSLLISALKLHEMLVLAYSSRSKS
jgi:hypothetical protein